MPKMTRTRGSTGRKLRAGVAGWSRGGHQPAACWRVCSSQRSMTDMPLPAAVTAAAAAAATERLLGTTTLDSCHVRSHPLNINVRSMHNNI